MTEQPTADRREEDRSRSRVSRGLTLLDRAASRPLWAAAVLGGDAVWVVYSVTAGFPARLETIFQTLVAALTLTMVFVIQHTQGRQQAATQRKLDEILFALPAASNALMSVEHASDSELRETGESHHAVRRAALTDPDDPDGAAAGPDPGEGD